MASTIQMPSSLSESIYLTGREIAGWLGSFAAFAGAFWLMSNYAPIVALTNSLSPTIAAASFTALANNPWANAQKLAFLAAAYTAFNKGMPSKYFKMGKDAGKDMARSLFGIGKEAPETSLSGTNLYFQLADKAADAIGLVTGVALTFGSLLSIRTLAGLAFSTYTGTPVGAFSSVAKETGIFAASLVATKEGPELVGRYGEQFGKGVAYDAAYTTASGVVYGTYYVTSSVLGAGYSAVAGTLRTGASFASKGAELVSGAGSYLLPQFARSTTSSSLSGMTGASVVQEPENNGPERRRSPSPFSS